jgi:hypothetical protein
VVCTGRRCTNGQIPALDIPETDPASAEQGFPCTHPMLRYHLRADYRRQSGDSDQIQTLVTNLPICPVATPERGMWCCEAWGAATFGQPLIERETVQAVVYAVNNQRFGKLFCHSRCSERDMAVSFVFGCALVNACIPKGICRMLFQNRKTRLRQIWLPHICPEFRALAQPGAFSALRGMAGCRMAADSAQSRTVAHPRRLRAIKAAVFVRSGMNTASGLLSGQAQFRASDCIARSEPDCDRPDPDS